MSQENLMQNSQKNTLQNLEKFQLPRDFPSDMHANIASFFSVDTAMNINPGIRKNTTRRLLRQVDEAVSFLEEIDADERKKIYKVFVKIQKSYQQDGVNLTLQKIFELLSNDEEMRKKLVCICKADPALAACVMDSAVLRSALPEHERKIYFKNVAARILSKFLGLMLGMIAAILKTVLYVPQCIASIIRGGNRGRMLVYLTCASAVLIFAFYYSLFVGPDIQFAIGFGMITGTQFALCLGIATGICLGLFLIGIFEFILENRIYGIKKALLEEVKFYVKLILSPFSLVMSMLNSLYSGYVWGAGRVLEKFSNMISFFPTVHAGGFFYTLSNLHRGLQGDSLNTDARYFGATETVAQIAHDYTEKYGEVLVGIDAKIDRKFGSYSNMSFSSEEKLLESVEPEEFVYPEEPSYGTFGLGRALRGVSEELAQPSTPSLSS
jgi:hypothetical protein